MNGSWHRIMANKIDKIPVFDFRLKNTTSHTKPLQAVYVECVPIERLSITLFMANNQTCKCRCRLHAEPAINVAHHQYALVWKLSPFRINSIIANVSRWYFVVLTTKDFSYRYIVTRWRQHGEHYLLCIFAPADTWILRCELRFCWT